MNASPFTDATENTGSSLLTLPPLSAQAGIDFVIDIDYKNYTASPLLPRKEATNPGVYAMVLVSYPLDDNKRTLRFDKKSPWEAAFLFAVLCFTALGLANLMGVFQM